MMRLSNRDQRWQCVTDDRQPQGGKELVWTCSEFKGERDNMLPRVASAAQTPRESAHRENRNGESAVFAVTRDDGPGQRGVRSAERGMSNGDAGREPLFSALHNFRKPVIRVGRSEC